MKLTSPGSNRVALVAVAGALVGGTFPAASANGAETTEQVRPLATFTRIRSEGAVTVRVTAGVSAQRVAVRGAPDVVARTLTTLEGDTLVIGMMSGSYESSPTIEIDVATLRGLEDADASTVSVSGLSGPSFDLVDRGASHARVVGRVDRATYRVSGAGTIDATGLVAADVVAIDSGAGRIWLDATHRLAATVSGAGHIRYGGNPAIVEPDVSGSGSIRPSAF